MTHSVRGAHVAEDVQEVRTKTLAHVRTLNGDNESLQLVLAQFRRSPRRDVSASHWRVTTALQLLWQGDSILCLKQAADESGAVLEGT
eukprot:CAMPEP_0194554392 /NCGR_PEP_ID=MMETSP0253-20130528/97714_1 /TAXON_ID=2966 /ORGANISM="Noctiluca scintillans" /LENGTH=87 /DNA_ID=CAMNT_0039401883 /DNA_START=484 /DNA_END=747 /DNA_ORIENTATION=+